MCANNSNKQPPSAQKNERLRKMTSRGRSCRIRGVMLPALKAKGWALFRRARSRLNQMRPDAVLDPPNPGSLTYDPNSGATAS